MIYIRTFIKNILFHIFNIMTSIHSIIYTYLRRETFYERCGYRANIHPHVHPPYRAGFPGHELVVMSRPEKLSHAEYGEFAEYLRECVMGQ